MLHRGALDDEAALGRPRRELRLQSRDLLPQPLPLLGLPQREHHFIGPERLGEVVVRAFLHRRDRRVFATIGAHHDHERAPAALPVVAQERQAVHLRHAHIAEHEVERLGGRALEPALAILFGDHGVAGVGQQEAEALAEAGFIVDDEDSLHRGSAIGKNSLKAAPPSRAKSTHTTPPMSCTERATMSCCIAVNCSGGTERSVNSNWP